MSLTIEHGRNPTPHDLAPHDLAGREPVRREPVRREPAASGSTDQMNRVDRGSAPEKGALKTASRILAHYAFAPVMFAMVMFAMLAGWSGSADAQNVRPPETASTAASDGPTGGNVPGNALGIESDAQLWRQVRKGVTGTVSIPDTKAGTLVQSEGDNWRAFRNGPLASYGAWSLAGMVVLLLLFYLLRGKIRIEHGPSSERILRFNSIERTGHWLLATSFIILAISGLNLLYGRYFLLDLIGPAAFAWLTNIGKLAHHYIAFAFMAGLVMIFVAWVRDNLPGRYDFGWLIRAGGLLSKHSHPPARKFNAGQKIIFWLVMLGGISLAMSGLALMFPFQTALFAKTFAILNTFGFDLPTALSPLQEMQLASIWHAVVSVFMVCVILAHIYIGSIGMEGAFDAMGSGEVDLNWAREHHSVWVEEEFERAQSHGTSRAQPIPAE